MTAHAKQGKGHRAPHEHEPERVDLIPARIPTGLSAALAAACESDFSDLLAECDDIFVRRDAGVFATSTKFPPTACVVLRADVIGLPLSLLESIAMALEEFEVVVGPAFDGSVYALGAAQPSALDAPLASLLRQAATGMISLEETTAALRTSGVSWFCLAPWYCAADAASRRFGQLHLQACAASEDDEFLAEHCLRVLSAELATSGARSH